MDRAPIFMARYRSSVSTRLRVSWERITPADRAVIVQLAHLPGGATLVPFQNFSAEDLQRLVAGMRVLVNLGDECRFALGYRSYEVRRPRTKPTRIEEDSKARASESEENPD